MVFKESYTAASSLPAKLLKGKDFCFSHDNNIKPVHIQICPTNKCNLKCSFCSCSKVEKKQQIDLITFVPNLYELKKLGMKAVTITGGGEPTCYPHLGELIDFLHLINIKSGLVTNGFLLDNLNHRVEKLTWCRVSVSDDRNIQVLLNKLEKNIIDCPTIDWAFSYVITEQYDPEKLSNCIEFANKYNFTHIRVVSDLMNLYKIPPMHEVKESINNRGIKDDLVIYQDRQQFTNGVNNCWVSLLKPLIAPDGYLYPCCGVQYALPHNTSTFPQEMRMCHVSEINKYFKYQKPFNGSVCEKCYYSDYNSILDCMEKEYNHREFV